MKMYGDVKVQLYPFLTSTLDGGEWLGTSLGEPPPGVGCMCRRLSQLWTGRMEKSLPLTGIETRSSTRNDLLY
jgi:hypothetical protein